MIIVTTIIMIITTIIMIMIMITRALHGALQTNAASD